jgi:MFS family permease
MVEGLREAVAYVRSSPSVAVVLASVLVVSMLAFNFNVLLPVLARETLGAGPDAFGILSAFFGAGALLGALTAATIGRPSTRFFLGGTAAFGLAELVLAPQGSIWAAGLLLVAAGAAFTLWSSNANAVLQLGAPDRLRGRVLALYYLAFNGTMPVGGVLAGWLAQAGGTPLAFAVGGAGALGASVVAAAVLARSRGRGIRMIALPTRAR